MESVEIINNGYMEDKNINNINGLGNVALLSNITRLQWVSERARKIELIKAMLQSGTYTIDPKKVALSICNLDLKIA